MSILDLFGRPRAVVVALVIAACAPAYNAAHQVKKARRFDNAARWTRVVGGYLRVSEGIPLDVRCS